MCAAVQLPLSHNHTPSTHHSTSSRVPVHIFYYISIAGDILQVHLIICAGLCPAFTWPIHLNWRFWKSSHNRFLLLYKNHVKRTVVIRCYIALWLWVVCILYYLDYSSGTEFSVSFQATCVVLLCKGSSGLPSSPVQYDTFHLWWWRNHHVQPYQGPCRSFISNIEFTYINLLSTYYYYYYCWYLDLFI